MLCKHLYLEIGAAGNIGRVYVNGQLAGESRCGYAMFRVFLNPWLQQGDNLIAIAVDNRQYPDVFPLMADFTFYGGLYRDVKLLMLEDVHFDVEDLSRDGVYVTSRKVGAGAFELKIRGRVVNRSSQAQSAIVKAHLFDQEGNIVLEASQELQINTTKEFKLINNIHHPVLWDGIEQPYLYTVSVSVIVDGEAMDQRDIEHGFRSIEVTPDRGLFLNGKPLKLRGVSRHQDYAGVGNAVTKTHMEQDMEIIREMGANSIRLAHYQHDDYFYTLCDRYGLLVWAEIPYITIPSSTDQENKNAKEQLERLIKQAYNHCSIYCWGVQNEITIGVENENTYNTVKQLHAVAKELDPSRYTVQANVHTVDNGSPLNDLTDLVGYNLYYGWYYGEIEDLGKRLDNFHHQKPNVPLILSEYGVDTNPKYHSYTPKVKDYTEEYQLKFHLNAIRTLEERAFMLGGYVWNMFDFGSANRNEGGVRGQNLKGLVSFDRKLRKDAYYLYKAHWSKEPFVHIAGRRFMNRHERLNDILIFSNLHHLVVFKNETIITEIQSAEPVTTLREFVLSPGVNRITAEGYDIRGNRYTDTIVLHLVQQKDMTYVHASPEENKHVTNWFEKFDLTNVTEVELREGYYSTFDTVEEIYRNDDARVVFEKYFGKMAEDPRFAPMRGVMSIEKMSGISALKIPKELLSVINAELNQIKK
jgi:beta-galactosidase